MSVIKELNIKLHEAKKKKQKVDDLMLKNAMAEINRDENMPLEARGGETVEHVNELFNLIGHDLK